MGGGGAGPGRRQSSPGERDFTLIRYDIGEGPGCLRDAAGDKRARAAALVLIEAEMDARYRERYTTRWR